jgi:exopolysaccharide biosynthesis polyprenyl glycosylphosphotransferase
VQGEPGGVPLTAVLPDADPIAGHGAPVPAPPLGPGPARLGSRIVAEAGRYVLVWLSLAIIAAAQHPLGAQGLIGISIGAAVWLVALRAASAGVPYALGPWVPALLGTTSGLVGVAALNPYLPGLHLSALALFGAAAGVLVSIGIWECMIERTLGRRRVLVIGSSEIPEVAAAAQRGRRMAFEVLEGAREEAVSERAAVAPSPATLDALTEIVSVRRPDLIVLADDQTSSAAMDRLLDISDGRFRVAGLTSFYEYALGCVPLRHITPMWFMSLLHVRQRTYSRWLKRAFDIVVATGALIVTAPLLPFIALAVGATPGPIIYRQIRLGEGGRRFTIYKFRTMVDGAERAGEAVWAQDADPRTTPVGAFLRRTHLDELPQLYNVLCGDMSMVGPRPERPEFIALLEESIPFWSRRLLIKPGMTGWAQVHRDYAADCASAHEKLAYDFWYLRHRNLAVDLAVCVKTLRIALAAFEPVRRARAAQHPVGR